MTDSTIAQLKLYKNTDFQLQKHKFDNSNNYLWMKVAYNNCDTIRCNVLCGNFNYTVNNYNLSGKLLDINDCIFYRIGWNNKNDHEKYKFIDCIILITMHQNLRLNNCKLYNSWIYIRVACLKTRKKKLSSLYLLY